MNFFYSQLHKCFNLFYKKLIFILIFLNYGGNLQYKECYVLQVEDHPTTIDIPMGMGGTDYRNQYRNQLYRSIQDHVPFPRTSGARFCSTGNLICL